MPGWCLERQKHILEHIFATRIHSAYAGLRFGYHGLAFQNINTENGAGTVGNVSPPFDALTQVRPCTVAGATLDPILTLTPTSSYSGH